MTLARHENLIEIMLQSPEHVHALIALLNEKNVDACKLLLTHQNLIELALSHPEKLSRLLSVLNPETLDHILASLGNQSTRARFNNAALNK